MSSLEAATPWTPSALEISWPATAAVPRPARALPRRQRQVLQLFARGLSQKVIAYDLGIAGSTVATHLRKALAELRIQRQQVPYAVTAGSVSEVPMDAGDVPLPRVLTTAEADVIRAILRGGSNERIARERCRSIRTVANQIASAFRKLGISSRRELYARAAEWRLQG